MIGFQLGALTYSDFINEDAELGVSQLFAL